MPGNEFMTPASHGPPVPSTLRGLMAILTNRHVLDFTVFDTPIMATSLDRGERSRSKRAEQAGEAFSNEGRKLRTEPCELSTVVNELDRVLAAKRTKVLNLPPLPPARRVN